MKKTILRGALITGAVLALSIGASASPAMAAGLIPNTHSCQNFGSTRGGNRAGHCIDLGTTTLNNTSYVFAQAAPFCQNATTQVAVQCAGISTTLNINDVSGGYGNHVTQTCGSYGGHACPTGRMTFNTLLLIVVDTCEIYQGTIQTTIQLPGGATEQSTTFMSVPVLLTSSGPCSTPT